MYLRRHRHHSEEILFFSFLFNPFHSLLNVIKQCEVNEGFIKKGQFPCLQKWLTMLQKDFKNLGNLASPKQKKIFKFRPVLKADCIARAQYLVQKSEKELKCIYILINSD